MIINFKKRENKGTSFYTKLKTDLLKEKLYENIKKRFLLEQELEEIRRQRVGVRKIGKM